MHLVVLSLRPIFCIFDISPSLLIPDINWSWHLFQYSRLPLFFFSWLKERSLRKDKTSDRIRTRAFQIFINCDHIIYHSKMIILISKYFLKDVVKKDTFTLTFKSQFCNLPEIRCQSFEIPFKFTFHVVFPSHKTTFFVATHTGDQFNFITTQPKSSDSSSPPTQAINYDR